jgi:His-Xaa-Ser system protein HxsD
MKNIKINEKEGSCLVSVNTKLYPLDVVYSAAYVFIDRAYIVLEGDKNTVKVMLKPKNSYDLEKLGLEFNNELLNYAFHKQKNDKTKAVREAIMQRALITNDPSIIDDDALFDEELDEIFDDPEGIAIPWEEKYGKKAKKSKR